MIIRRIVVATILKFYTKMDMQRISQCCKGSGFACAVAACVFTLKKIHYTRSLHLCTFLCL